MIMQLTGAVVNRKPPENLSFLMLSPAQCRAGRALLEWSRDRLAEEAGVGVRTVVNFESGARAPRQPTLEALLRALTSAGVIVLYEGKSAPGGEGARLAR
jgi:transcriptional regulator with XRE-family HTH domain